MPLLGSEEYEGEQATEQMAMEQMAEQPEEQTAEQPEEQTAAQPEEQTAEQPEEQTAEQPEEQTEGLPAVEEQQGIRHHRTHHHLNMEEPGADECLEDKDQLKS